MNLPPIAVTRVYLSKGMTKGAAVSMIASLAILFEYGFFAAQWVGYIGAIFLVSIVLGALLVSRLSNEHSSRLLVLVAAGLISAGGVIATVGILSEYLTIFVFGYAVNGIGLGVLGAISSQLASDASTRGKRFMMMARLSIFTDTIRVATPALLALLIVIFDARLSMLPAIIMGLVVVVTFIKPSSQQTNPTDNKDIGDTTNIKLIKKPDVRFGLILEMLDSMASAELVAFMPLLFVAKGFSIENSLLLQAAVFVGYMSGRWMISSLADKKGASTSIVIAEVGMAATIVGLLLINNLPGLYLMSIIYGLFARGTSPVIQSMVLDSLDKHETRKGSALYIIAGESGGTISQLGYGLLIAWIGVEAPFVAATIVVLAVAASVLVRQQHTVKYSPPTT